MTQFSKIFFVVLLLFVASNDSLASKSNFDRKDNRNIKGDMFPVIPMSENYTGITETLKFIKESKTTCVKQYKVCVNDNSQKTDYKCCKPLTCRAIPVVGGKLWGCCITQDELTAAATDLQNTKCLQMANCVSPTSQCPAYDSK